MAKMLILEKNVNVATSDRDIINNMYKVRFEQNKFVVYDWDFKKTTKIFNFSMFVDIYKEFINSELRFEKFETARSDNEWVNVCMDLVKSGNIWLYLTDSNDILGFIILSKDNDTMIIHELAVSEISRGNGYGKQLLEFADILANDMHLNTLRVRVFDKNTVAKNMYISYGFHEIGSYDSETSNESLYSTENVEQIKRTGKYTYNNKKRVGGRRRFKCLDCGQRFHEFMQLYHHAEKFHKDLIGDEDVYIDSQSNLSRELSHPFRGSHTPKEKENGQTGADETRAYQRYARHTVTLHAMENAVPHTVGRASGYRRENRPQRGYERPYHGVQGKDDNKCGYGQ